jgi:hypothetical protein
MRGHGRLLVIGIGLGLLGVTTAASTRAGPSATDADAGQISAHPRSDVSTGQIGGPARGQASAPRQVSGSGRTAAAPPPLSSPSQGRNTAVGVVSGHDRCDPTAASAQSPECAQIADRKPDELAPEPASQAPTIADTQSDSASLVNSILSGGTGTVVTLPPATEGTQSSQGDAPR